MSADSAYFREEDDLCRKLYEALRSGRGVRLSYSDVWLLIMRDDAMATRITNAAGRAGGLDVDESIGGDAIPREDMPTWAGFVTMLKETP